MTTDTSMLRLREANPFPETEPVQDDELLARITASPADPRLRPRSGPATRRALVLALAVLATALLASTAYAISSWIASGDVVKPKVTRMEYREATHELALPPGASWPKLHVPGNSVTGRGAGGGHAVLIAQNLWECYWVQAIRDGDVAAQAQAHQQLESLLANNMFEAPAGAPENWTPPNPPSRPYAVFAHDGGLEWIRQNYVLAAAGHPQRLIESCRANAVS
jgi:hypothetical protein